MKKHFLLFATLVALFSHSVCFAQTDTIVIGPGKYHLTDEGALVDSKGDTMEMLVIRAVPNHLDSLMTDMGLPTGFNSIYDVILTPLCNQGVIIFELSDMPLLDEGDIPSLKQIYGEDGWNHYFYGGLPEQRAKLARNLTENKNLFTDGHLVNNAGKRWKVVD